MIHENIQRVSENVELREFYRFESKLVLPFSEKIFFFPLDKIFHEFLFYIELNERAQSNENSLVITDRMHKLSKSFERIFIRKI